MSKKKPSDRFVITDGDGAYVGDVPGRSRKGALTAARLVWGNARCVYAKLKEVEPSEQNSGDENGGQA